MAVGLPKYKSQVQASGKGTAQSIDPSLAIKAAGAGDALLGEIVEKAGGIASDFLDKKSKLEEKARAVGLEDYTERWISEVDTEINNKLLEEGNTLSFEDIQKSVIERKTKEYDDWVAKNLPEKELVGRERPLLDSIQNKAKRTVDIKAASNIAKRKAEKSVLDISNRYLSLETELYNLEKTSPAFRLYQLSIKVRNNTATDEERKQFAEQRSNFSISELKANEQKFNEKIKQKEELGLILDRTMDPIKRRNLDINARKTRFKTQLEYEVDQYNLGKIATVEDLAEKVKPILDEIKNDDLLNQGEKDAITYNVNEELRDVEIKEIRSANREVESLVNPDKKTAPQVAFGLNTRADTKKQIIIQSQLELNRKKDSGNQGAIGILDTIGKVNTGKIQLDDALRAIGNQADSTDQYNRAVTVLISEIDSLSDNDIIVIEGTGVRKDQEIQITEANSPIVKHLKIIGYRVAAMTSSKDPQKSNIAKVAEDALFALERAINTEGVKNQDGSINADKLDEVMNTHYDNTKFEIAKQIYNQG